MSALRRNAVRHFKIDRTLPILWRPSVSGRHRVFGEIHQRELLEALGKCRQTCTHLMRHMTIGGDVYKTTEGVTAAIDKLAEVLTGDRQHFWLKRR